MKSSEQLKVIDEKRIAELVSTLSSIGSRASEIENKLNNLTPELLFEIETLLIDVNELLSRNKIDGGDITISQTAPSNPQENDIWFDLRLVRSY